MTSQKIRCTVFAIGTLCLLCGCQGPKKTPEVVPATTPAPVFNEGAQVNNPGSLFAQSDVDPLFSDNRARRVGDIVVVNIIESATATNAADTDANKDNTNTYSVAAAFGRSSVSMFPFLPSGTLNPSSAVGNTALDTSSYSDFQADGSTSRSGSVISSLAARVIRVMPGGNLQIEGVRQIRVNEETQYMVVSGTIRARDVASDNSIMSTQIADANIQYYGQGVIADKQKPGWFTRFMDNLWPF